MFAIKFNELGTPATLDVTVGRYATGQLRLIGHLVVGDDKPYDADLTLELNKYMVSELDTLGKTGIVFDEASWPKGPLSVLNDLGIVKAISHIAIDNTVRLMFRISKKVYYSEKNPIIEYGIFLGDLLGRNDDGPEYTVTCWDGIALAETDDEGAEHPTLVLHYPKMKELTREQRIDIRDYRGLEYGDNIHEGDVMIKFATLAK